MLLFSILTCIHYSLLLLFFVLFVFSFQVMLLLVKLKNVIRNKKKIKRKLKKQHQKKQKLLLLQKYQKHVVYNKKLLQNLHNDKLFWDIILFRLTYYRYQVIFASVFFSSNLCCSALTQTAVKCAFFLRFYLFFSVVGFSQHISNSSFCLSVLLLQI